MIRPLLITYFIIFLSFSLYSKTLYLNSDNGYGSLSDSIQGSNVTVGGALIINNSHKNPVFHITKFNPENGSYYFEMKIANHHNIEGKEYKYTDGNKNIKILNPAWGMVWEYRDSLNYCSLELKCANSNLHDLFDKRSMKLEINRVENGKKRLLKSDEISENINLHTGENVMAIKYHHGVTSVMIGNKILRTIHTFETPQHSDEIGVGIIVGSGAKINLTNAVLEFIPSPQIALKSLWDAENLDKYFAEHNDIYEGYWDYLDRTLDETRLRIGGRYRIALVKSDCGYDIIYVDGAKVNDSAWVPGMIKGKLRDTRFEGQYDLEWNDALMKPFNIDVYARIIDNVILELNFPIQKSKIRFSKAR